MNKLMRALRFGKGLPATLVLYLLISAAGFGIATAVREVPEYQKTTGEVTAVQPVEVRVGKSRRTHYATTIVVREATDGQTWTLHRELTGEWPVGTDLNVYELTNGDKPVFDLSEPQDPTSFLISNILMGLFMAMLPAGIIGVFLYPISSGGGYGGGSSSDGSSATVTVALFAAV